jgi:hypothetical protein
MTFIMYLSISGYMEESGMCVENWNALEFSFPPFHFSRACNFSIILAWIRQLWLQWRIHSASLIRTEWRYKLGDTDPRVFIVAQSLITKKDPRYSRYTHITSVNRCLMKSESKLLTLCFSFQILFMHGKALTSSRHFSKMVTCISNLHLPQL